MMRYNITSITHRRRATLKKANASDNSPSGEVLSTPRKTIKQNATWSKKIVATTNKTHLRRREKAANVNTKGHNRELFNYLIEINKIFDADKTDTKKVIDTINRSPSENEVNFYTSLAQILQKGK